YRDLGRLGHGDHAEVAIVLLHGGAARRDSPALAPAKRRVMQGATGFPARQATIFSVACYSLCASRYYAGFPRPRLPDRDRARIAPRPGPAAPVRVQGVQRSRHPAGPGPWGRPSGSAHGRPGPGRVHSAVSTSSLAAGLRRPRPGDAHYFAAAVAVSAAAGAFFTYLLNQFTISHSVCSTDSRAV